MITQILLAVDDTDVTERAVTTVIDLASSTGADVAIVHSRRVEYLMGAPRVLEPRADAERLVDQVAGKLEANGVHVTHKLVTTSRGNPAHEILDAAWATHASLVVLGAHEGGRPALRSLLGSVTHKVVADSHVPVLTVV